MILNFDNIKKYILTCSKLLSIVICLYYIFQFKNYEVSWNLLRYFFPLSTSYIDIGLSTVGTFILFIPLIIIIVSFFEETSDKSGNPIKQSFFISILGKIFGLGIIIISLIMQLVKGNLHEYIDLRFLTIYKHLTLEAKRELFVNEFIQIVTNLGIKAQTKLDFLMIHVQDKYLDVFEKTLIKLPTTEIKGYAQRIVNELLISYDSFEKAQPGILSKVGTYIQNNVTLKGVLISLGVCIAVYGIYYFGKSLTIDNAQKQADLVIDSTTLNQAANELASKTLAENLKHTAVSTDIANSITHITKVVTNLNKNLGVVTAVNTNNVTALQNHTTVLNVILNHFPEKGQYENFINFLVNMYNVDYATKNK